MGVNNASDSGKWWSPDGALLSQSFNVADFSNLKDPFGETRKTCRFAVRFSRMTGKPQSVYLEVSGEPRTLGAFRLQPDAKDPWLFYGAELLYPEQLESHRLWIEYSTLPWNKLTLDATGKIRSTQTANPAPEYLAHLFIPRPFSLVREKDGKSLLQVGMEIWRDFEFTATAIAKDGSSHSSTNLLTGLITDGDNYNLQFNLLPSEIVRFEISIRGFDQLAAFTNVSLEPDHQTIPTPLALKDVASGGSFDDAFYSQLFERELGRNVQVGNLSAAIDAATRLITGLHQRREHFQAEANPDAYLVDKALPIINEIHDALKQNDLATAAALLQADSRSGNCLRNALQRIAQAK